MSALTDLADAARFGAGLQKQRVLRYAAARRGDLYAQLSQPQGQRDPYAVYDRIRAEGPFIRTRLGNLATASHRLADEVLRSDAFGASDPALATTQEVDFDLSLLELDGADHTRLRRAAAPAFRPKLMAAYEEQVSALVDQLVDRALARRRFDLVDDFAAPLPITVITTMLGVPDHDTAAFQKHGAIMGSALDGIRSLRHAQQIRRASTEISRIFEDVITDRRRSPREDLVSALVADERVSAEELLPLCHLLLIAGFETTVNLIGNGMRALFAHPEQWDLLVSDPQRWSAAAVEEALRFDSPVQQTSRVAHRDTTVAGRPIASGQWVITLLGGANRDPEFHDAPNTFDLTRADQGHLSFSSGPHYCLGAPLARLEAGIAFRTLAERLPRLSAAGPVTMRRTTTIRGPLHLPAAV